MSPNYRYPRPSLTVDVVLIAVDKGAGPRLLLIQRKRAPFRGRWALPGGFLDMGEQVETAARRELQEETGLSVGPLCQLGAYGEVGRDPRGRTISVVFLALHCGDRPEPIAGDDASESRWFPLTKLPPLAFDHGRIISDARVEFRRMVDREADLLALLPPRFTISDVQAAEEAILGRNLLRQSLRRRLLRSGLLREAGHDKGTGEKLYRLKTAKKKKEKKK